MTTTSAETVDANYDAAITALQLVVSDVQDPSTGILGTEAVADNISEFERATLAEAANRCSQALAILQAKNFSAALEGTAYGSGPGEPSDN